MPTSSSKTESHASHDFIMTYQIDALYVFFLFSVFI